MTSLDSASPEGTPVKKRHNTSNREEIKNIKNFNKMSRFYKPALMTKNFTNEMPLFLSDKNLDNLAHLFKSIKYENKYQKSVSQARKFKRLKFINQQKTKTQDKLGELTTKNDIVSYLKKEPKDIFANALANFWFKDADKFIQQKKSM